MRNTLRAAARTLPLLLAASSAHAQWSMTNLHPPEATLSVVLSTTATDQAGWVAIGDLSRASAWRNSAASWLNLHPVDARKSIATSTLPAGSIIREFEHASLWTAPQSAINLNPLNSSRSYVSAATPTQQVGFADINGVRASLWQGTAASWISLNPAVSNYSFATCTSGDHQGGVVYIGNSPHASFWSGTAESWVDLHPESALESAVYAITASHQVGYTITESLFRAALWSGTPESWIDLHPPGAVYSYAAAATSHYQAGLVHTIGDRAALWSGSASTHEDLHASLPSYLSESVARALWSDGTTLRVGGYGFNNATLRYEALLWTRPVCYTNCDFSTTPPLLNINDFACFLNRFASGDGYANCDASTVAPVLNINDFTCFVSKYAAGCL